MFKVQLKCRREIYINKVELFKMNVKVCLNCCHKYRKPSKLEMLSAGLHSDNFSESLLSIFGLNLQDLKLDSSGIKFCCLCGPLIQRLSKIYEEIKKFADCCSPLWNAIELKRKLILEVENADNHFSTNKYPHTSDENENPFFIVEGSVKCQNESGFTAEDECKSEQRFHFDDAYDDNDNEDPLGHLSNDSFDLSKNGSDTEEQDTATQKIATDKGRRKQNLKPQIVHSQSEKIILRTTNVDDCDIFLSGDGEDEDQNGSLFQCKLCSKRFKSDVELVHHEISHPAPCPFCGLAFLEMKKVKSHMYLSHEKDTPGPCQLCQQPLKDMDEVKKHYGRRIAPYCPKFVPELIDYEKDADSQNYSCPVCKTRFSTIIRLKKHIREYIAVLRKKHSCDECEKVFRDGKELKVHKRVHTGEKPFNCSLCDKKFSIRGNLKLHGRMHTVGTPYACEFCDKGYKRPDSLKYHLRKHTGELAPILCSFCDRRFHSDYKLNEHERRIHTAEISHVCSFCGKSFYAQVSLKQHEKIHHPKVTASAEVQHSK